MEKKEQEIIVYPCAACKIQRRKCGDKCMLAPYFPPNDTHKFSLVNRLFGASRIAKILQDIPVEKRADVVESLVYEASARVVDPIYGCTGAICRLQKQILNLQSQLATTQADLLNAQANFVSFASGLYNGRGPENTFGVPHDLEVKNNDEIIVLQNDLDLLGWEDTIFPC